MKHLWVLVALAVPLALVTVIAGGAHAHNVGSHPDLAVENVSTDPYPPTPNQEVDVTVKVSNADDADDANAFDYAFTLNGEELGEVQTYGDDDDEPTLASGDDVLLNATVTWGVDPGEQVIGASVDHQDGGDLGAKEHQEDDNQGEQAFTIGPDLAVTDVQVDPSDAIEGDQVELTATVENLAAPGDTAPDADGSFQLMFFVDGQPATSSVSFDGLAAGGTETVSRMWPADGAGDRAVRAAVDTDQVIPDRDRSNNDGGPITLNVRPALPDLVVSQVTYTPDPVEPGQQASFNVKVANNGNEDAGEHDVALRVGNETADIQSVESVAQGEDAEVTLTWEAEAGNHEVEILVDPTDEVSEVNDGNNAWTLTIPVGPDLVVRDFDVQPSEPRASDRVRFTVEIGNEGLGVEDPFQIAFDVGDDRVDTVDVAGLAADEVRNITSRPWNASVGDHNVSVIVDPDGAVDEVDNDNNRHHRDLTIGEPRPDVAVLSAVLDPSIPEQGEEVTVRAQLENAGPRSAEAFTLAAHVDDEELGETRVEGLEPGETATVDIANWTAEAGPHTLEVEADADGEIDELSEDNNLFVRSFGIGTDLAVLDVSLSPSDPQPGEEITALALLQNNGTVATPAANVSFEIEGSEVANASLDPLEPSEQASLEATFTASLSGDLEVLVDADEQIDEFDEDNNVGQASLELQGDTSPPDLTVRSVSVEGDLSSGEAVRFTATIANVGEGPSSQALVDFRVDGSSIGDAADLEGLAAGGETEISSAEWTPSRDEHELSVVVDADERVGESNETNNTHVETFEGSPMALPLSLGSAALALLAAAFVLTKGRGSKRKPPKR